MENKFNNNEEEVLITFLNRTKKGDYAVINKESLPYVRIKEQTEENQYSDEENYFYGIH